MNELSYQEAPGNTTDGPPNRRFTVLIIDDNKDLIDYLTDFFKIYALGVLSADTGAEGINVFEQKKPNLVITDIRLPDMFGNIVIRELKKIDKNVPIIVITGYSDHKIILSAMKNGAIDLIKKPFKPNDLKHLINKVFCFVKKEKGKYLDDRGLAYLSMLEESYDQLNNEFNAYKKRTEEESKRLLERYRAICGSVAHGLKNEFLHIGTSISEIQELNPDSEDITEECTVIERSLSYSQVLLNRMTGYLEIGKPKIESVEVSRLLAAIELMVKPRLRSAITMKIMVRPTIKKMRIQANEELLLGILLELIENASDALVSKGNKIEIHIKRKKDNIIILVKDNGPGLPEDITDSLLKEQVTSKKGQGLGLLLCQKIAAEFQGELSVPDSSSKGTTFQLILKKAKLQ